MTIVTTHYRYKRPPKKRKSKGPVIEGPRIVHAKTPKPGCVPPRIAKDAADQRQNTQAIDMPANDDREPAIVTARKPGKPARVLPLGLLPETPDEHKQRGDAADALWREMKRRIARRPATNRHSRRGTSGSKP